MYFIFTFLGDVSLGQVAPIRSWAYGKVRTVQPIKNNYCWSQFRDLSYSFKIHKRLLTLHRYSIADLL